MKLVTKGKESKRMLSPQIIKHIKEAPHAVKNNYNTYYSIRFGTLSFISKFNGDYEINIRNFTKSISKEEFDYVETVYNNKANEEFKEWGL